MGAIGATGATGASGAGNRACVENANGLCKKCDTNCKDHDFPENSDGRAASRVQFGAHGRATFLGVDVLEARSCASERGVSNQLKTRILSNRNLRDQLRDAAASARRMIAEGFGRRTHRDIANFLATSLTSLNEVEDELGEALDNGYVTDDEIASALNLKKRAFVATSRFRNSLKDRPDPEWNRWPARRASVAPNAPDALIAPVPH